MIIDEFYGLMDDAEWNAGQENNLKSNFGCLLLRKLVKFPWQTPYGLCGPPENALSPPKPSLFCCQLSL